MPNPTSELVMPIPSDHFAMPGSSSFPHPWWDGGGGGGYFGGTTLKENPMIGFLGCGGAGGSSYVSGCSGCQSVEYYSKTNEITTTSNPVHYSGLKFTNIKMLSGVQEMKSPLGQIEIGHTGSGAAAITFIGDINQITCKHYSKYRYMIFTAVLFISS